LDETLNLTGWLECPVRIVLLKGHDARRRPMICMLSHMRHGVASIVFVYNSRC
jgi:hypothetical protein